MKNLFLSVLGILFFTFVVKSQDLTIDQFNLGYDYDPSTGIISNLNFSVMNIDNTEDINWSFNVAVLLSDPNNPNTTFEADRLELNSLSASSSVPISNWDIDLNNVSGLPSGDYRLGIYVDIDDDISETDENNNYYYISPQGNDLTFNSSSGIFENNSHLAALKQNFPNPVTNYTLISFIIKEKGTVNLSVYDCTGKLVKNIINNNQMYPGEFKYIINMSEFNNGIYYYSLVLDNKIQTKRFEVIKNTSK